MEGEIAGQSHRISRDLAKQHAKPKWSKGQGKSEVSVFTWKKRSARCTKKKEEENEDGQLSVMQKEKETKENHGEWRKKDRGMSLYG